MFASLRAVAVRRSMAKPFLDEAAPGAKLISLKINNRPVQIEEGRSLLAACKKAGAFVPTLCAHPMLSIVGHCRVCLVEIGSEGKLVPACATKATEGLSVKTHSPAVVESVRHNLQFLTCRHPNVCATCEANGNCEFQRLSYRFGVHELLPGVLHNPRSKVLDTSSNSLVRDMDKCVLCSRCIRACSEIQGMNILGMAGRGDRERVTTVDDLPISATACISCGQCTAVCPVGALIEKPAVHEVHDLLANADGDLVLVAQTAPAVRVAISEEFGLPPGTASTGKMVAALKQLGFHYVFDTNFSADVTIMEEATEFVKRLTTPGSTMPMFTSCCPGWINLVEKTYPKLMPHLSTCKSPQGMLSSIIKHVWAKKNNINPEKIRIVSIMPCVAKKDEAARPQLRSTYKQPDGSEINTPDTDYVLTTRELGHLIQNERIPFATLPDVNYDTPFGESTGAAALFAATGGVMEAALRTANFMVTGKDLEQVELHAVRGLASGLANIRETTVDVGGIKLNMAVVTGTRNVRKVVEDVLAGTSKYHLIEVMACPGGCVGGGGEPKTSAIDKDIVKKRIEGIWRVDGGSHKRMSHHNQSVKELYTNDLKDVPLGSTAHHLLHTHYSDRTEEVLGRWDDAPPGAPPPVTHDEAEKNAKH